MILNLATQYVCIESKSERENEWREHKVTRHECERKTETGVEATIPLGWTKREGRVKKIKRRARGKQRVAANRRNTSTWDEARWNMKWKQESLTSERGMGEAYAWYETRGKRTETENEWKPRAMGIRRNGEHGGFSWSRGLWLSLKRAINDAYTMVLAHYEASARRMSHDIRPILNTSVPQWFIKHTRVLLNNQQNQGLLFQVFLRTYFLRRIKWSTSWFLELFTFVIRRSYVDALFVDKYWSCMKSQDK